MMYRKLNFPKVRCKLADGTRPSVPEIQGDPGSTTTLNHVIQMYDVVPDVTIGDVMDIRGLLCFEYVDFRDD
jgi:hypothetical protein